MSTVTIDGQERELDSYLATAFAEGFCEGEGASAEDQLRAWAYLIKFNICWQLNGWFGRSASSLIENEIISIDGVINWEGMQDG